MNSLVAVLKPNGKIRLCIDSKDLNRAIKREQYLMKTIDEVITRMPNAKFFSKLDATQGYCQVEVTYIGHTLSSNGLKPDVNKVEAIRRIDTPNDKPAVQRFLGMATYLAKFIPNFSQLASPLRVLLEKNTAWHWDKPQQDSFES